LERARKETAPEAAFKAGYAFTRDRVLEIRSSSGDLKKREAKRIEHNPKTGATNEMVTDAHGHREGDEPDDRKRAYERRDFQLDPSLLARYRFEVAGRETIGGRETWQIDFRPADKPPSAHNLKERFLNRVEGRVWVDATDYEAVRLHLRLTEPVSVLGGLAGVVKSCRAALERQRTAEGHWFTRQMTWHLEGRQLLTSRVFDFKESLTDVRPAAP